MSRAKPDLAAIFPMPDEASAELMTVKADCLLLAGVITETERRLVDERAAPLLRSSLPNRLSA